MILPKMISEHISMTEATKSRTAQRKGIDNTPDGHALTAMQLIAEACFEPLRRWHGKAIGISSFLRAYLLNRAVGGSRTSYHMARLEDGVYRAALDIDADIFDNGITNSEIFYWLKDNVDFDKIIWEFGTKDEPAWVHIQWRSKGNRKQLLRAERYKSYGRTRTRYVQW